MKNICQIQTLSLYRQIELFKGTQQLIKEKIGEEEAKEFFEQSRYVVAIGSNDFINNYLLPPIYNTSFIYSDQGFITHLMQTLQAQLTVITKDYSFVFYQYRRHVARNKHYWTEFASCDKK